MSKLYKLFHPHHDILVVKIILIILESEKEKNREGDREGEKDISAPKMRNKFVFFSIAPY